MRRLDDRSTGACVQSVATQRASEPVLRYHSDPEPCIPTPSLLLRCLGLPSEFLPLRLRLGNSQRRQQALLLELRKPLLHQQKPRLLPKFHLAQAFEEPVLQPNPRRGRFRPAPLTILPERSPETLA